MWQTCSSYSTRQQAIWRAFKLKIMIIIIISIIHVIVIGGIIMESWWMSFEIHDQIRSSQFKFVRALVYWLCLKLSWFFPCNTQKCSLLPAIPKLGVIPTEQFNGLISQCSCYNPNSWCWTFIQQLNQVQKQLTKQPVLLSFKNDWMFLILFLVSATFMQLLAQSSCSLQALESSPGRFLVGCKKQPFALMLRVHWTLE